MSNNKQALKAIQPIMRLKQASIIWCSIALLLGGLLLPASASFVQADTSGRILLCTAQGYQWVSLADLSPDKQTPSQPKNVATCLLCIMHNGISYDGVVSSDALINRLPRLFFSIKRALPLASPLLQALFATPQTRAPPHLVISF